LIDVQFGDRVVFVERAPLKAFHLSFHLVFLYSDAFPVVERHDGEKNYDSVCRDSDLWIWSLRTALDWLLVPQLLANSAPLLP
jgi:hypothetical protein